MDFVLAKHGLKVGIKISYILVSQKREKRWRPKREKNGGEEKEKRRREEEEEEEKEKRREEEEDGGAKRYGTTWAFKALNGFPCNCMVISCLPT